MPETPAFFGQPLFTSLTTHDCIAIFQFNDIITVFQIRTDKHQADIVGLDEVLMRWCGKTQVKITKALLGKGAALGSVLAFMMSVIALSLPEMVILRKVLKPKLIAVFVGVVACGILFVGYLFNMIL